MHRINYKSLVISLQIYINYPKKDDAKELLLNNLAIFKAKLILKSIEDLNVDDKTKEIVLEKVLEILDNMSNNKIKV